MLQERHGCVFMQNGKFIAHSSHEIKEYEHNYPIYDLEFVAVVFVLKI